jgi:hypothetical protein
VSAERFSPGGVAGRAAPLVIIGAALALLFSAAPDVGATSFAPTYDVSLANPATGASSDITVTLALESPDAMYQGITLFIPQGFGLNPGALVTDGAMVGMLSAPANFGLIGSPCNVSVPLGLDLLDGSTNISETVSFQDLDGNTTRDFADDDDGDGLYDGATRYPEPLTRILPGITPRQRMVAMTPFAGIPYMLNILIFEPGTPLPGYTPPAALGYPAVVVLQDEGDPQRVPEPGPVSDTCSPLDIQAQLYGVTQNNPDTAPNESGIIYRSNPLTSGVYRFAAVARSQPDADGDGYENPLDTCPLTANAGNPRVQFSGDLDGDGLDAACDPLDNPFTGGTNFDEDGDGYLNRQDNCPLASNGEDTTNQADGDLDGIGNACDPAPSTVSGHTHTACPTVDVTVGAGGPMQLPVTLPCDDTDGDGIEDPYDNCPTVPNAGGQAEDVDGDIAGDACDGPGSGNVDCTDSPNAVNAIDALKVLRFSASLSAAQSEPCLDIGMPRLLKAPLDWKMGDVDCDGNVNAIDALKILRAAAGLSVTLIGQGCPPVKP